MQSLCFAAATSGGEREGESEMKGAAAVERRGYNNRYHLGTSQTPWQNVLYCLRRSTWHSRAPQQDLLHCPQRSSRHLSKTMARLHTLFPKKIISIPVNTSARPHFVALEDDISITQNSLARQTVLQGHNGENEFTMERMSFLSIQLLHHRTEYPENSIFRPERCMEGRRSHNHITEELIKLDLMEQKTLLRFLILILGFSFVLSSRLLPDQPGNEDPSVQEFVEQGLSDVRNRGEGIELEETSLRARMDIESIDDYSPPGANHGHDPPPPHSRARMDIESIDDYSPPGPNHGHDPPPPHSRARMDIESIDDHSPPGPNHGHNPPPPPGRD
ncbi:hypothetical protein NE237_016828 [Protea cynaroides]|uniref:Uncharacterized protein n=1 Tax=Protea cynaroides TaxID=273540 RepID=A0A9Q0HFJ2_9MAGN|nr:hypothetical protein NE237_016828 [Protea cynaroides]